MPSDVPAVELWSWAIAVLPIPLLVLLVLRSRWTMATKSLLTAAAAVAIGAVGFGAGPAVLAVGVGKGVWTGIWILYVIWTALLLYQVAARAGLDKMGQVFSNILPREIENVLLVAWVFPSFIQGVAGFGTPIAVAAPILLSMRSSRVNAVVLPLVGYHWSVTFGSMGSSFYMGALTAGVDRADQGIYAMDAAAMLGVNMFAAGALVCLLHGGVSALRCGARMLLVTGSVMFLALNLAVRIEPSIGTLAAGAAGLASIAVLRRRTSPSGLFATRRLSPAVTSAPPGATTGSAVPTVGVRDAALTSTAATDVRSEGDSPAEAATPSTRRAWAILTPYLLLLLLVLGAFLPPASRTFVKSSLLIGPSFPGTATPHGVVNPAVDAYTPIALLGHPGSYLLLSTILGLIAYQFMGIWPRGAFRSTLGGWFKQARRASVSVIALAVLATVMVDTGMVRTIAVGAADVTGALFPAVSPLIGALGSFMTGSTTTSNALFSALQSDVAGLIGVQPPKLLAAQTVGGNVGNALAPVVILIGLTAVGAEDQVGAVFRRIAPAIAVLLTIVTVLTFALIMLR